jgi:D-3-phosphoglycerate dehydrogenase / 2-oxoglutarate reductase
VLGIRSKTKLTARVLSHAKNLIVVGCFCIGTNQVDLSYAAQRGICVFNSPFSNSRSVAELVIAEVITLARQLGDRNNEMHAGTWNKVSAKCWEIRGKTLGIIGYGHIGSQLSVLAESMGMDVIYYDVVNLMAMGNSRQVSNLDALLSAADFVTCHVPELPETQNMIGADQLSKMKDGSYLINASRGSVVDIPALIDASRSGKLAGAALDVYPSEPGGNGDYFTNELNTWAEDLRSLKNVILTPHIGGSTEEAQSAIGVEVAEALVRYVNEGVTLGAVNMPEVTLRSLTMDEPNHARVVFIHQNVPGVLRKVNETLGDHNVDKQMSDSRGEVAYLMADISSVKEDEIALLYNDLEKLEGEFIFFVLCPHQSFHCSPFLSPTSSIRFGTDSSFCSTDPNPDLVLII